MDLGTVAYFKHPQPLEFFKQAHKLMKILEACGYNPMLPPNLLKKSKGIGCFTSKCSGNTYFAELPEIPQDISALHQVEIYFRKEESGRQVVAIYRFLADYNPLSEHVAVWKIEFDGIDIHPSFAFDYASVQHKLYCENASIKTQYYSMEEVFLVYNLIKKLYLEVGFDLAAGTRADECPGYGERINADEGFDRLFRFDANGTNRLIKPYEEGRTITTEDIYGANRNGFFVDYDHPVPIIVQEPPYNVPDISVT